MKISIKKLGGFAGIEEMLASVDSDRLPKATAGEIRNHLRELSALSTRTSKPVGADQFHYEIEITETGVAPRTVSVIDEGDPNHPAMKHVAALLELAGAKQ